MPSPTRSAATLVSLMARLVARDLAAAIEPLGLAPAQFMVLRELWKSDGLTQGQLAIRVEVDQATMAKTLARMVRDGLVVRKAHPRDARAQLIMLTDRALELKKPAKAAARAVNATALGALSEKEQDRLLDLLHRVVSELSARRREVASNKDLRPSGADHQADA